MTVQRTTEESNAHSLLLFKFLSLAEPYRRVVSIWKEVKDRPALTPNVVFVDIKTNYDTSRQKPFNIHTFTCFHSPGVKGGFIKGDAIVACVASVSVWFRSNKRSWRGIFGYDYSRNETRTKKWKRGRGRGRTKRLQTNPRFWKPAFASERSAWLARLVEQYWHVSIKGLFHTERSCMVRDTHLNFLQLMFILVQGKRIFFRTSFETQRSSPPLPALLLAPIFAWSLTLVPHSLLLNSTETLAT